LGMYLPVNFSLFSSINFLTANPKNIHFTQIIYP